MAVRQFVASNSDDIITAAGALADIRYGTIAAIVKRGSTGGIHSIISMPDSTDDSNIVLQIDDDDLITTYDGDDLRPAVSVSDDFVDWYLIVVRKEDGSDGAYRYSALNLSTSTWTHADAGSGRNWDHATPVAYTSFGYQAETEFWDGLVAARAVWANALPWSADAPGDAAIEAAGLETAYQNWIDASPSAAWRFNQDATTTAVVDDTGNGADQTAISGTAVVNGDDPPGFDFSLAAGVTAAVSQSVVVGQSVTAAQRVTAAAAQSVVVGQQATAQASVTTTVSQAVTVGQSATAAAAVTVVAGQAVVVGQSLSGTVGGEVTTSISQGVTITQALAATGEVLVNLDFVALAPVFRRRVAAAPQFRDRTAPAPVLGHGEAGEPTFTARAAGEPVSAHGDVGEPTLGHGAAGEPTFAHGEAGEPEF